MDHMMSERLLGKVYIFSISLQTSMRESVIIFITLAKLAAK